MNSIIFYKDAFLKEGVDGTDLIFQGVYDSKMSQHDCCKVHLVSSSLVASVLLRYSKLTLPLLSAKQQIVLLIC